MNAEEIISELRKHYNQKNVDGMARFGIVSENAFGISAPVIKSFAKKIGKNHGLALELWQTGYYDARVVAFLIDDPKLVTESQMNNWVRDFDSWAICDGTCCYLFRKTPFAFEKIHEWADRKEEFVRRTSFSLMAYIAVHDKKRDDKDFLQFFPLIKKYSVDKRNFVKKAVNWALRQIGKRSKFLNKEALKLAKEILRQDSRSARWIANDAIRELVNPKTMARLKR
jgi:3-methyladenine DNA glycosylase AlkD